MKFCYEVTIFFVFQMKDKVYKVLLGLGLVILFHAAYSTTEWRSITRQQKSESNDQVPLDITIQTLVGIFIAMIGVLNIAGEFKEIRAGVELGQRSWEDVGNRPSFYGFNHRGKAFSPGYDPPPPASSSSRRSNVMDIPEKFLS